MKIKMKQLPETERNRVASLFQGQDHTMIRTYLEGYLGTAWTDSNTAPRSAQIIVRDFCFFGGIPSPELAGHIPVNFSAPYLLMAPPDKAWGKLLEDAYGKDIEKFPRYALHLPPKGFDRERLTQFQNALPAGFTLRLMDQSVYALARQNDWSKDLCLPENTKRQGIGMAVFQGDLLVGGASSYTFDSKGMEIEIDISPQFRRRGLGRACAAGLILYCLEQGILPYWDAANQASLALAQQLGYVFDREYIAYEASTGIE